MLEAQKEASRFGEQRLQQMRSTKKNLLRHQASEQKGSLWHLPGQLTTVSAFLQLLLMEDFWEAEQVKVFAEELNFKRSKSREAEWKWNGPGEMSDFVERNF